MEGAIVHEPGKGDRILHTETSCNLLQLIEERSGSAEDQLRVRMASDDTWHRLDEIPLTGQGMQALHVQQHVLVS